MKPDTRQKRHQEIADAAYAVLGQRGYAGASLLTIAKAAKASNETLYRWYENKQGLFAALVEDNAREIKDRLDAALAGSSDPLDTLRRVGPLLLGMLLGEKATLLNRAAASDPTNELGRVISRHGREVIAPLIIGLFDRAPLSPRMDSAELAEIYLAALVGDLQIRRVIGVLGPPDAAFIGHRADRAAAQIARYLA